MDKVAGDGLQSITVAGAAPGLSAGRTGFPFNAGQCRHTLTKSKTPRTLVRGVVKLKQLSDESS
jgi:hypothetical protein